MSRCFGYAIEPGLILHIPLNRQDGESFFSVDSFGHLCTASKPVWSFKGRIFNGTDDRLIVNNSPSLSGLTSLTIECWFRQEVQSQEGLVSKRDDGTTGKREWEFVIDSSGKLRCVLGADAEPATNHILAVGTRGLSDNNWYHGVATWNGVNSIGNITLYIDGERESLTEDQKNGVGAVPWDSGFDVQVGRYSTDTYCFTGTIGEVRIYNRVLTLQEIQRNYLQSMWKYR